MLTPFQVLLGPSYIFFFVYSNFCPISSTDPVVILLLIHSNFKKYTLGTSPLSDFVLQASISFQYVAYLPLHFPSSCLWASRIYPFFFKPFFLIINAFWYLSKKLYLSTRCKVYFLNFLQKFYGFSLLLKSIIISN